MNALVGSLLHLAFVIFHNLIHFFFQYGTWQPLQDFLQHSVAQLLLMESPAPPKTHQCFVEAYSNTQTTVNILTNVLPLQQAGTRKIAVHPQPMIVRWTTAELVRATMKGHRYVVKICATIKGKK